MAFVGKAWLSDPLTPDLHTKLGILARHLDGVLVTTGRPGIRRVLGLGVVSFPTFRPPLAEDVLFHPLAAVAALASTAGRAHSAIVCQSPYEAFSVLLLVRLIPRRWRPRVVVEVHGDWRTAIRLYGSPRRRLLAPVVNRVPPWSLAHADRVRVVGAYAEALVRAEGYEGDLDSFLTFCDLTAFLESPRVPPPAEKRALFIGVLQRYKAPDVLLQAWARVVRELPDATLRMVGAGPMRDGLLRDAAKLGIESSVEFMGTVPREELVRLIDDSTCLVLPSRSEGLGRVVLETMARARPVIGSRIGGIPEVVRDGINGLLVPAEDPAALAHALVAVLGDAERARIMGEAARASAEEHDLPGKFEDGIARLAAWALAE